MHDSHSETPIEYSFQACSACEFCGQKAKKKNLRAFTFDVPAHHENNSSSILSETHNGFLILFYIMFFN